MSLAEHDSAPGSAASAVFPLSKLPPELLIEVLLAADRQSPLFAVLDGRRVCKSWNTLINTTPAFWRFLRIRTRNKTTYHAYPSQTIREQARLFLENSKGNIEALALISKTHKGTAEIPGLEVISEMIPWASLRSLWVDDRVSILPPVIYDNIRQCSSVELLVLKLQVFKSQIQPDDPICAAAKDSVSITFSCKSLVTAQRLLTKVLTTHLLAQTKSLYIFFASGTFLTGPCIDHLNHFLAQRATVGFYESLTLRFRQSLDKDLSLTHDEALIIAKTKLSLNPTSRAENGLDIVELTLKHPLSCTVLASLTSLQTEHVRELRVHGMTHQATYELVPTLEHWPSLDSINIQGCTCRSTDYELKDLYQALEVIERIDRSYQLPKYWIEVRHFERWVGSGTLDAVKYQVEQWVRSDPRS